MLSIVYSSTAHARFSPAELAALLEQSRSTNAARDLTGLLVHREGHFLQLIEGPDQAVRETMDAISADHRHGDIRVLLEDSIEHRQFPDWTMGYGNTAADSERIPGYRRTFDDIDADRSESGTLPALRALIAWFREEHDAA